MNQELLYSQEVLELTPERATRFLQGIGALPVVRTLLAHHGMKDTDIEEGRTLLLACLAQPMEVRAAMQTESSLAQRAAAAELDQWDEPNFARFGAALRRHHPSAYTYVFSNLKPASGVLSAKTIATFLSRLDALESGSDPARSDTKASDANAIALLTRRGLTPDERKRLRKLVDVALGPTDPLAELPKEPTINARLLALNELRAWYDEWATVARIVVKRRADLIRLGLAARRKPINAAVEEADEEIEDAVV